MFFVSHSRQRRQKQNENEKHAIKNAKRQLGFFTLALPPPAS
jgi:hypothetical protein